jgi:iron-sulfur cluster repair protein YtfE (RIC family)
MLVTLGARHQGDELVDALAACHGRIRQHLVLARRLVLHGPNSPASEVCETASQLRRYFSLALPLHVADEEAIAPRLVAAGDAVAAVLGTMSADHARHQYLIDRLIELCEEVERDPARLSTINARLSRLVEVLATELATHLELEEQVVFPAIRLLPERDRASILEAIRLRREDARGT